MNFKIDNDDVVLTVGDQEILKMTQKQASSLCEGILTKLAKITEKLEKKQTAERDMFLSQLNMLDRELKKDSARFDNLYLKVMSMP